MLLDLAIAFLSSVLLGGLAFGITRLFLHERTQIWGGVTLPMGVMFFVGIAMNLPGKSIAGLVVLALLGGVLGGYLVQKTTSRPIEDSE